MAQEGDDIVVKILFVCEGNMMRSQMAEAFYNTITNTHDAISAGAVAEQKTHISPRAIEALGEVGIDSSSLAPTQLVPDMLNSAEIIVYFPSEYMPRYVIESSRAIHWNIADPHYHKELGMEFVRKVRDEIKVNVEELIQKNETQAKEAQS